MNYADAPRLNADMQNQRRYAENMVQYMEKARRRNVITGSFAWKARIPTGDRPYREQAEGIFEPHEGEL